MAVAEATATVGSGRTPETRPDPHPYGTGYPDPTQHSRRNGGFGAHRLSATVAIVMQRGCPSTIPRPAPALIPAAYFRRPDLALMSQDSFDQTGASRCHGQTEQHGVEERGIGQAGA